jgi:multiple sugar transport system substrate-binding protein
MLSNRKLIHQKKMTAGVIVGALVISSGVYGATPSQAAVLDSSGSSTLSVLYSNNYVFNSDALATKWWNGIAAQWAKLYPNVHLKLLGTGGTDTDEMNKAAVLFRDPSQTPDVIQLPTTYVGEFSGSGYLASLNQYVDKAPPSFWTNMPAGVKAMSTIGGQVYAINAGNNDSGILYNKTMFTKAGIALPWKPKTWADVLSAAEKIKAAEPSVYPLWLAAGVEAGPTNVLQGSGNLIDGSTNPTMYDTKTGKWVVNSPGLTATLQFYKTLYSKGLGAPTSQLFRTDSVGQPPLLMQQGKLAIAIGSNWYPTVWAQSNSSAPWAAAPKDVGVAPIPTENGQGPGAASTLGGWVFSVTKASKNQTAAWNFIKLASSNENQLNTAIWSGFVPPDPSVGDLPAFVNYAPPFQAAFNQYSKYGVALPNSTSFNVYARALNTVTGDFAQTPSTSIKSALGTLKSLVTEQLGSSSVETQG